MQITKQGNIVPACSFPVHKSLADTDSDSVTVATRDESVDARTKTHRRISFGHVTVRLHKVTLGDKPEIALPLSLHWEHRDLDAVDIDSFEKVHKKEQKKRQKPVPISVEEREARLREMGHDSDEIEKSKAARPAGSSPSTKLSMDEYLSFANASRTASRVAARREKVKEMKEKKKQTQDYTKINQC